MNPLQLFLTENDVTNLEETFRLPGRLSEFDMKIKAIPADQYTEFQNRCIENPNSKKRKFNTKRFNELIVINGLTNPSLKDIEFMNANGCSGNSEKLMYKVFLPGEINEIAERILNLSGFGNTFEEEIEEVKNS